MSKDNKKSFKKKLKITCIVLSVVLVLGVLGFFVGVPVAHMLLNKDNTNPTGAEDFIKLDKEYEDITFEEDSGLAFINNQVVVMAASGADKSDIESIARKFDADITDSMEDIGFYCFTFSDKMDSDDIYDIIDDLKKHDAVDDAFLNPVIEVESSAIDVDKKRDPIYPKDPWGKDKWDCDVPRNQNWGMEAINAPDAWAFLDELDDVRVGLIDSVINTSHEDLKGVRAYITTITADKKSTTKAFKSNTGNSSDHGCHVGGIIAANWNKKGVSGIVGDKGDLYFSIAYDLDENGQLVNDYYDAYGYFKAIKTLVDEDVQAINISQNTNRLIGFAASRGNENAIKHLETQATLAEALLGRLVDKVELGDAKDFVICVAAGNINGYVFYENENAVYGYSSSIGANALKSLKPVQGNTLAKYNNFLSLIEEEKIKDRIIVVGSVGIDHAKSSKKETRYAFSYFSNEGERVDIVAPGEDIYSVVRSGYDYMDGTSMATPHVTGAAGLAFAANPELSGPEVKAIVCSSTSIRFEYYQGHSGLLDLSQVVKNALKTRTESVNKVVPGTGSGLDLCFVVDTTGSMGDDIDNAKENMVSILNQMSETSKDYRIALVDYRDFASRADSRDYPAKVQLEFTDDNEKIKSAIMGLGLGNGGDTNETVYSGINEALKLSWRAKAKKAIIILGDAPPLDPEPETNFTYDDVFNALYNAGIGIDIENSDKRVIGEPEDSDISVYTIGIGSDSLEFFDSIAKDTGGGYTNIESADEVSSAIIDSIKQIKVSAPSETDFGEENSKETVEIYRDGEFYFEFELDESGMYEVKDAPEGEYEWKISRLGKSGEIVFFGEEGAEIDSEPNKWYTIFAVVWFRFRVVLISIALSIILILVLVLVIVSKIKKKRAAKRHLIDICKLCPICKKKVDPSADFCDNCGAKLPTVIHCPFCNAELSRSDKFCDACGKRIE